MANTYKHSGMLGDLIYSLPIVKHTGGGKFFLHLNQAEWIGKHYYNSGVNPFHKNRMTLSDFEFMREFMLAQEYITEFLPLDIKTTEITHNLDRFRPLFIQHPGNYVDCYADSFAITDNSIKEQLRNTGWITVPNPTKLADRDVAINRTSRWLPPQLSPIWNEWKEQGIEQRAFFLGLPDEHTAFCQATGWDIPHHPTKNLLQIAQCIAGSKVFIGNQSVALSLALGLGHRDIWCEGRRDLPIERNECYFQQRLGLQYF